MNYYLIAGEASGDLHGANLMKKIKKFDSLAEFRFWGGDLMKSQGGTLVRHYKDHDYMGVVEVVKHLKKILNNIKFCMEDIEKYKPDAVIFIDFPGFNLRLTEFAKKNALRTYYYISPTVWAWKSKRALNIKKFIDKTFVEMDFVRDFYKNYCNHNVEYVGHPLVDAISQHKFCEDKNVFLQKNNLPDKPIVAVLPGSREYEIRDNLRTMQEISDGFSDYQFVIAGMSRFSNEFYHKYIGKNNVKVIFNKTYDLLKYAEAAIVVSGSATLETAIIGTPEVLVYKTNPITFYLGKMVVNLKFLGLPNLVMNEKIIPELLQSEMNAENLKATLNKLLYDKEYRSEMINNFSRLREKLGNGTASEKTAKLIVEDLKSSISLKASGQ